jgi:hypothetical protein
MFTAHGCENNFLTLLFWGVVYYSWHFVEGIRFWCRHSITILSSANKTTAIVGMVRWGSFNLARAMAKRSCLALG